MGKKDFSNSTENVFDDFFTQPTVIKEREVAKNVENKPENEKKEVKITPKKEETKKEKAPKQAEIVKEEVKEVETKVEQQPKKLKSQYFNKLIREHLLSILGLPANTSNDVNAQKWEEYKKENNI